MQKQKLTKLAMLTLFSFILLANLSHYASACTAIDQNSLSPTYGHTIWVNCTVDQNPSNGIGIFINTLTWNQPNGWFLIWVGAYISIAFFLLVQDRSFARYNTITLMGLILAVIMRMYNLVSNNPVIIGVSLFGLSLFATFFLHSNR